MEYPINIVDFELLEEPVIGYGSELLFKEEVYKIISCCFEVYNTLGRGFLEIVYKDALEHEFKLKGIPFEREKKYDIVYKDAKLPHYYFADFVLCEGIIFEVKAQIGVVEEHYKQVINYLAVSGCKLGLIVNFGENKLLFKRVVL